MLKRKEILKNKSVFIATIIILIIIIICAAIIVHQKTRYDALNEDYHGLQSFYSSLNEKYRTVSQKEVQNELQEKINDLNAQKETLQNEVNNLTEKKNQLNSEIVSIKGQPLTFPAGYFTAGIDFEAGRYKIYDGNSNFIVYSARGDLKVNTILGNDPRYSVSEYIYNFNSGDKIQAGSSFKLILVS